MNIYQRILKVCEDIDPVQASGYNEHQKYNYIKWEEIITKSRNAMIKHGVVYCSTLTKTTVEKMKTARGETSLVKCEFEHTFFNAEKPDDCIMFKNEGWGADNQDKGINKANTGAKKYAFFTMFLLASDDKTDDPEHSGNYKQGNYKKQTNQQSYQKKKSEPVKKEKPKSKLQVFKEQKPKGYAWMVFQGTKITNAAEKKTFLNDCFEHFIMRKEPTKFMEEIAKKEMENK